jgi:hypothetical protein
MRLAVVACVLAIGCTKTGPQECPSLQHPSARSEVTAVVVPDTNQIYALGGQGAQLPLDELWRYSFGACGGWTRLVLPSSPGPRANYAAALDTKRSRIVYIGGGATNDVWALDTNGLTFTKLAPVGTPPIIAAAEVAAYDADHDRVIYAGVETFALEFGGSDQGKWTFIDGTTIASPSYGAVDPTRSLLFVLNNNGLHGFSFTTGTWRFLPGHVPNDATLLWDDTTNQLVAIDSQVYLGVLDANGTAVIWKLFPTANTPPLHFSPAVALSGRTVWFSGGANNTGCPLDDLWTLDLDSGAWTNVWPATTCL